MMEVFADIQGYGTALGVITAAFEADQLDQAYYAQTAPYHQGTSNLPSSTGDISLILRLSIDFVGADNAANTQHYDL